MRITTSAVFTGLTARPNQTPDQTLDQTQGPTPGLSRRVLGRVDDWTRWAFNPQPELTSRYDRAA